MKSLDPISQDLLDAEAKLLAARANLAIYQQQVRTRARSWQPRAIVGGGLLIGYWLGRRLSKGLARRAIVAPVAVAAPVLLPWLLAGLRLSPIVLPLARRGLAHWQARHGARQAP